MAGTVMPDWRPQFLDANGAPLSSGTVETYEAGSSTPLATYSDAALSVTNGTSLTLNSGGFPQKSGSEVGVFLLPRAYKFILKNSAGVTQRTLDNVYALQSASSVNLEIDGIAGVALSAGDWAYLSNGSGALTAGRWYQSDADFTYASTTPILAFVPTAIAQGATGTFRIGGIADGLAGLVAGSTYYISATAGAITATPPTNARAVGVASSSTVIALDSHLGNALPSSFVIGDLLYASSTTALARLADVATGQVLVSGGVGVAPAWSAAPTISGANITALNASNLASGTVPGARLPSGSPVQRVSTTYATQVNSSSATFSDTGLTLAITPTSASNKVRVDVRMAGLSKDTNNTYIQLKILRDAVDLGIWEKAACYTANTNTNIVGGSSIVITDTPATTSAVTYKVQFNSVAGTAQTSVQYDSSKSSIELTEITP